MELLTKNQIHAMMILVKLHEEGSDTDALIGRRKIFNS